MTYTSRREAALLLVPFRVNRKIYWAVLDTAAGRSYISRTLSRDLKREPVEWVIKSFVTIHSEASPKRLPRYDFEIQNIEGEKFETDTLAVSRENLGSLYRTPMKTVKKSILIYKGNPFTRRIITFMKYI